MTPSTLDPWTWHGANGWSPRTQWSRRRGGMPSTRVSGRAALPKRAPTAAIPTIPSAIPMASRSWRAGTTRGWGRSLAAALLELDRSPARPPDAPWGASPPSGGRANRLLAGTGASQRASSLHVCRRLCADPTQPGLGQPAGRSARAGACGPLFLRRPSVPTVDRATAASWGEGCLR
jgi:hypothetical protein